MKSIPAILDELLIMKHITDATGELVSASLKLGEVSRSHTSIAYAIVEKTDELSRLACKHLANLEAIRQKNELF